MDDQWYADVIDLVRRAQEKGFAAFMLHTLEIGDVRLVGLSLPTKLMSSMLITCGKKLEAQLAPDKLN
jgi:hypothetical protein